MRRVAIVTFSGVATVGGVLNVGGNTRSNMQQGAFTLLGGEVDWKFDNWHSNTDQVRGGVSTAFLRPHPHGAEFTGVLDPSKLGAGFAGMEICVVQIPSELQQLTGLRLEIACGDGKDYSLSLKPKGAIAGSSYKFRFTAAEGAAATVLMPYKEFEATCRGRSVEGAPLIRPEQVESLTIQIASDFGRQKGNFSLILASLNGEQDE